METINETYTGLKLNTIDLLKMLIYCKDNRNMVFLINKVIKHNLKMMIKNRKSI